MYTYSFIFKKISDMFLGSSFLLNCIVIGESVVIADFGKSPIYLFIILSCTCTLLMISKISVGAATLEL